MESSLSLIKIRYRSRVFIHFIPIGLLFEKHSLFVFILKCFTRIYRLSYRSSIRNGALVEDPRGGLIVTHTYVPLYNNNNYEEQLQQAEQTEPLDLSRALAAAAEEKPALPLVQPSTSPPVVDLTISPAPGTKVRVLSPTSSVCRWY